MILTGLSAKEALSVDELRVAWLAVKFCRRHLGDRVEIYVGERSINSIQREVDELRYSCGRPVDLLTSTQLHLAVALKMRYVPIVVLLCRETVAYGAVLLSNRTILGAPSGILTAGYVCGRGATIAMPGQHTEVAEIAAAALLRTVLAHTVVVRLQESPLDKGQVGNFDYRWSQRESRSAINLEGDLDQVLSRFSYKLRRNIRYYKRRAERDLGCIFIPDLSPAQSQLAVEALNGVSKYRRPLTRALQYEARLAAMQGSFAMGLRDNAGNWLSFITGWRQSELTYIEWQLNRTEHEAASLSTVMRAYCLEHEVGRGSQQMIFVGGTNQSWRGACAPQPFYELFAVRKGVQHSAVQAVGRWLRPHGVIAEVYAE